MRVSLTSGDKATTAISERGIMMVSPGKISSQLCLPYNIYVDKTELFAQLMNAAQFLFLARPRRFRDFLLISILAEIYRGNRDLFQRLWIADQIDWQPHPVIAIDFNNIDFQDRPLGEVFRPF